MLLRDTAEEEGFQFQRPRRSSGSAASLRGLGRPADRPHATETEAHVVEAWAFHSCRLCINTVLLYNEHDLSFTIKENTIREAVRIPASCTA